MIGIQKTTVGLSDSELIEYSKIDDNLAIKILSWDNRIVELRFSDVIYFCDIMAACFSDIIQDGPGSKMFLDRALLALYGAVPGEHPYKSFCLLNHDGDPSIEIVATSFYAIKNE